MVHHFLLKYVIFTQYLIKSALSGTGRNMAPFLSLEWGREGMQLMREIKDLFDPSHILNPGVILNDDPRVHIANLKHMTPVLQSLIASLVFLLPPSPPLACNAYFFEGSSHHRRLYRMRVLRKQLPHSRSNSHPPAAHRISPPQEANRKRHE